MMRIENWSIGRHPGATPYTPPELCLAVSGDVYDSPHFPQGEAITTSRIISVDFVNQSVTTISGSVYELGVAHPDYEKEFPNARARFFKEI
jgi:hypothetical protein